MPEEVPTKLVVDLSKPIGDPEREQVIPLTAEEIAEREAAFAKSEEERLAFEAELAAKAAAKEAAAAKLAVLGLTAEEIAAITS